MIVVEPQETTLASFGCAQVHVSTLESPTLVQVTDFCRFDLARQQLLVDRSFDLLAPFAVSGKVSGTSKASALQVADRAFGSALKHQALGYVNGGYRIVQSGRYGDLYVAEIEGVGRFVVDPLAGAVRWLDPRRDVDSDDVAQALLGPPFLLLAATQRTWILHASAVLYGKKLIAFVGKSGWGKSTLAAFLDAKAGWQRVSDDMLPVSQSDRGVDAWPRFPQYRLPPTRQPGLGHPPRLSLDAVYLLMPSDSSVDSVSVLPASPKEAATTIMGQTAGARLFDSALLARHFSFGVHAANTLRVRGLSYPRRFDLLPAVADALACDLDKQ